MIKTSPISHDVFYLAWRVESWTDA